MSYFHSFTVGQPFIGLVFGSSLYMGLQFAAYRKIPVKWLKALLGNLAGRPQQRFQNLDRRGGSRLIKVEQCRSRPDAEFDQRISE